MSILHRIKTIRETLWDWNIDFNPTIIRTKREPEVTLLINIENTPRLRPKTVFEFVLDCSII